MCSTEVRVIAVTEHTQTFVCHEWCSTAIWARVCVFTLSIPEGHDATYMKGVAISARQNCYCVSWLVPTYDYIMADAADERTPLKSRFVDVVGMDAKDTV
jgi:hypothetical protein